MSIDPADNGKQPTESRGATLVRRELILAGLLVPVGLFVLPVAIYFTGQTLLGSYSEDGQGLARLYGDIFSDLGRGFLPAWILVLSPWLGIQILRLVIWPLRRKTAAKRGDRVPQM